MAKICFIDDDGSVLALSLLVPLFEKYRSVFDMAVTLDNIGKPYYMSMQEIFELNLNGFNMLSHGFEHVNMIDYSADEANYAFAKSRLVLSDHFVYPFGGFNSDVQKCVLNFYKSALKTNVISADISESRINSATDFSAVPRVGLGAWQRFSLSEIKEELILIKDSHECLCFMTHSWVENSNPAAHNKDNIGSIESILDFALSNGIEVVNYSEIWSMHRG